jgi:8-oxo-dGTP diphosphatase
LGQEHGLCPVGNLEYGETLFGCAKRELYEELGIEGIELQLISIVENITAENHYVHASFLLNNFTGSITLMEPELCDEWVFFDTEQLPENIFSPHQPILRNYSNKTLYL